MSGFSQHKRSAGLILVLILVCVGLCTWVSTSPEFNDRSHGRTLIERWNEGARARLSQVYEIFGGKRSGRKSGSGSHGSSSPKEVTGPALLQVFDSRGRAVKDATVVFKSKSKSVSAKTDPRGRVVSRLPLGEYQVACSHEKYSSEVRTGQKVLSPEKGFSLNITLQSRVSVKGLVVDEEGKPLENASITGQRNWLEQFSESGSVFLDDAAYPTLLSGKDGKFRFDDVSIGDNTFAVSLHGYAPTETRMEIPAGGIGKELKVVLKRPSVITGRVIDEEMKPVKGVKVTAVSYQPHGLAPVKLPTAGFTASSNDEGAFKLPKLFSDGYYLLRFEHPLYAIMDMGNVSAGTTGLQLIIQRGGELSGNVSFLDRESTAARVLVQARGVISGTTITRTTMSRTNGNFSFERMPYGSYDLLVDYDNFVNEPRGKVTSVKDRPSTGILLEVYEASRLAGTVLDAYAGTPLADAEVTVKASYGFKRTRVRTLQAKADSHGAFAFDKLPGGTHQVMAKTEGFLPTSGNPADYTLPISPGGRIEDYTVFLSRGGIVKGQVVNQDGQGIGDSQVQLYVASGSFNTINVKDLSGTTDGSGFFEFRGFPIGQRLTLYVSATGSGYAKKHSDLIELSPQQPEMLTQVVLTPGGVVSGKITDTNNVPLYGVKVTFDSREFPGDPSSSEFYTFTDTNGNYLLERCSPGRAVLVADRDDFVRQTKSVTIPEGRLLSRQNFKLQLARNIRGTVADFSGHPIADARVVAAPVGKATGSGSDKTDKKGEFLIEGLGLGNFRLEASFTLKTPDGDQAYTFIVPDVPTGTIGVPIDCDVEPSATAKVIGREGKGVNIFTATLRSKLNTQPSQLFRFNLTRQFTKAGGVLRFLQIPRGIYTLKIDAVGYETWETDELVIGPGNRTNIPTIRLKPASSISGTAISSTTGKPVQGALVRVLDDSEQEIKTVNRIELQSYDRSDILERLDAAFDENYKYDPDPNSRLVARVRANVVTTKQTNVYGKFSVDDVGAGNYTLEIEHPAYRPLRLRNIGVGRDKATDLGEIELQPGGIIRGRVVDLEGNGISNAAVQVKGEIQGRNREHTDVAGNFTLRGIGYGDWTVSVNATLNGRKVYAWKKISVRPDETSLVEFVLETSGNVNGPVQLPVGAPRSGTVRLYVVDETGTVMDDIVYSDALEGGQYSISGIPPGRYFTVATGQGPKGPYAFWTWIDVNRGRNTVPLAVLNASMSGVAGNVLTGAGVPGATVQVTVDVVGVIVPGTVQNLLKITDGTDAAGRFVFPYLQAGTYRIWAAGPAAQLIPVDAVSIAAGQAVAGYKVAVQGAP